MIIYKRSEAYLTPAETLFQKEGKTIYGRLTPFNVCQFPLKILTRVEGRNLLYDCRGRYTSVLFEYKNQIIVLIRSGQTAYQHNPYLSLDISSI